MTGSRLASFLPGCAALRMAGRDFAAGAAASQEGAAPYFGRPGPRATEFVRAIAALPIQGPTGAAILRSGQAARENAE